MKRLALISLLMLAVSGNAFAQTPWQGAEGSVKLTVPDGWETFDEPDYAFFSETYIDNEPVANCYAKTQGLPNASGASQEQYNAFAANKTADTLIVKAPITRFSNTKMIKGVRFLEYTYEIAEKDTPLEMYITQFGFVKGTTAHAYQFTCAGPKPLAPKVKAGIETLLNSITLDLP